MYIYVSVEIMYPNIKMSGIVGMSSNVRTKISHDMYTKLISIQHRGSDFARMVSEGQNVKNAGSVQVVFEPHLLDIFKGNYLLGHVTSNDFPQNKMQLFVTFYPCDVVLLS
jgi:glutamine phosphoribosylpyrophosphate amidotransferase